MIAPATRTALHQAARRLALRVRIEGSAVFFFRPASLTVAVMERAPEGGWLERPAVSRGIELLAKLPNAERAAAWLRGFEILMGQEEAS